MMGFFKWVQLAMLIQPTIETSTEALAKDEKSESPTSISFSFAAGK